MYFYLNNYFKNVFCWGGKAPPDPPVFYSDRSIGRPADRSIGRPAGSVFSKISKKSHFWGIFVKTAFFRFILIDFVKKLIFFVFLV